METCASRPSSSMDTVTDITTTSRSACDTAELERCRGKALDLTHDHNKENGKLDSHANETNPMNVSRSRNPASQQWGGTTGRVPRS